MKKKYEKEILRVGKWNHPSAPGGVLEITQEYMEKLKENFNKTPFAPVLRGHVSNKEAEMNPALILNKNISGLKVDSGKLLAEMEIDEKELEKYNDVSVSIDPDYEDKETGSIIGPVLRHVAMVVNPYIKGMGTFNELSEDDSFVINLSDITSMKNAKALKKEKVELEDSAKIEEVKAEDAVVETPVEEAKPSDDTKVEDAESGTTETPAAEVVEEKVEELKVEDTEVLEEAAPAAEVVESDSVTETSEDTRKKIAELTDKIASLEVELSEKKAKDSYRALLEAGKIVPAQEKAYLALHEALKGTIDLADGSFKAEQELLVELFDKAPRVVELGESDKKLVDAGESLETKIESEIRSLPSHANKTDAQWSEYWAKNGDKQIAAYKKNSIN